MDNDIRERLAKWLSGDLETGNALRPGLRELFLGTARFLDIHISELLPKIDDSKDGIEQAYIAFVMLVEFLQGISHHVMVSLLIPLKESDDPWRNPPKIEDLLSELSPTPPVLYVVVRNWFRQLNPQEVHRVPLRWNPIHSKTPEAFVSYRISRALSGVINGWEFQRAIEIEHYPPTLIPTDYWHDWLSFVHNSSEKASETIERWRDALQSAANRTTWDLLHQPPVWVSGAPRHGGGESSMVYFNPYGWGFLPQPHVSAAKAKKHARSK